MKANTTGGWILWATVAILLVTSVLVSSEFRLLGLNSSEDNSVRHLYNYGERFTIAETINSVNRTSPEHMPAHHVQLSLWAMLVGFDFGVLRTMSLYLMLLSVAFTFRMGRDWFDPQVGLLSAILVAFSAYHMYFGHEIRMYTLVILQAILIYWLYWRVVISGRSVHWYHFVLLFLLSSYSIYTHSVLIFPLLAVGVYHLLFAPKNHIWVKVALAELLAGVTFLYWLPNLIEGALQFEDLTNTNQTLAEVLGSTIFVYSNGFWVGAVLLAGVALWKRPTSWRHFRYLITLLLVTLTAMLGLNVLIAYIPLERMRYTVVVFPVLAMLWALGLRVIWQYSRWALVAVLVIWMGFFAWFSRSDDLKVFANISTQELDVILPFQTLVDVLRHDFARYDDLTRRVIAFDSEYFDEYEPSEMWYYGLLIDKRMFSLPEKSTPDDVEAQARIIHDGRPAFWLAYRPDDADMLAQWQDITEITEIFGRYRLCMDTSVNDLLALQFYLNRELSCQILENLDREAIVYSNSYVLRDYVIEESDDAIDISFLWDSSVTFDNSYGYSLQVFHDGEKVAQVDMPIHALFTHSTIALDTVDAGAYDVHLIVYATDTVTSVAGQTDQGDIFERDVKIGQVMFTD